MNRLSGKVSVDQGLLIRVDERVNSLQKKLDDGLVELKQQLHSRFTELDVRIAMYDEKFVWRKEFDEKLDVCKKVSDENLEALKTKVDDLRGIFRWIGATAGGAIVLAIMSLILK